MPAPGSDYDENGAGDRGDGNHVAANYAPGTLPERDRPLACAPLPTQ
jgi:hypothetical protein